MIVMICLSLLSLCGTYLQTPFVCAFLMIYREYYIYLSLYIYLFFFLDIYTDLLIMCKSVQICKSVKAIVLFFQCTLTNQSVSPPNVVLRSTSLQPTITADNTH